MFPRRGILPAENPDFRYHSAYTVDACFLYPWVYSSSSESMSALRLAVPPIVIPAALYQLLNPFLSLLPQPLSLWEYFLLLSNQVRMGRSGRHLGPRGPTCWRWLCSGWGWQAQGWLGLIGEKAPDRTWRPYLQGHLAGPSGKGLQKTSTGGGHSVWGCGITRR